uniref:Uncharacterized protein n=1 Tax=Anopheles stephensi TaxID=30069 RepID=A0A182YRX4_ANOST
MPTRTTIRSTSRRLSMRRTSTKMWSSITTFLTSPQRRTVRVSTELLAEILIRDLKWT